MVKKPAIDTDKLKNDALQLRDTAAVTAGRVAVAATNLAEQGLNWAAPRAQAALETAIERATPVVETATERAKEAVDRTRPVLEDAAEKAIAHAKDAVERAKPVLEDARQQVIDDYLPRINRAVEQSASALKADGSIADRAKAVRDAATSALTTPTKTVRRKRRFLRALGWTAVTSAVAGAGYVLWKRSQPIEDPWAEEYWADLDADTIAQDVEAEVADAVNTAKELAADATDTVEGAVEDVKEAVEDTIDGK